MINIYGNYELVKVTPKHDSRIEDQQSIDLIAKNRLLDLWWHRYRGFASNAAQNVYMFIVARTLGFNKIKEIMSYRDISEGVYTVDNKLITVGTGLSTRSVIKAVQELESLGYIIKTKRVDSTNRDKPSVYEVNIQYFNSEISKAKKKEINLDKPKKKNQGLQNVTKNKKLIDQIGGFLDENTHTHVSEDDEFGGEKNGSMGVKPATPMGEASFTPLTTISKDIESKSLEREPLQPIGCGGFSEKIFIEEYNKNMKTHYGRYYVPPIGTTSHAKRVRGQLKHLYTKLTLIENLNPIDFIRTCITEWDYICETKLFFLEKSSKSSIRVSPSIGIILKLTEKVLEAYYEVTKNDPDKVEAVYGDATGYRARELQKMGYSSEYALKQALLEVELAKEKQNKGRDEVARLERKYELEIAALRKEQDRQLTLARNEIRKAKEEANKAKYADIYNFSLNNMVDPELEAGTSTPNQTSTD